MIGRLRELLRLSGGEWLITLTTRSDPRPIFDELSGKDVSVDISKVSKKRSKTANDFCWAMCTDIGRALTPPLPKEEVYRQAIKGVGKYSILHMKAEAIPTFRRIWATRGVGWFTEVIDFSPYDGCKTVFAYHGSSTYDSVMMAKLIDYLKDEMESMELPIPISKEEEERLLTAWQKAFCRKNESASSAVAG